MGRMGLEWTLITTPIKLKEISAAPSGTAILANTVQLYAKDKSGTSGLFWQNDAGTEFDLTGMVTGTGVSGRVAFWTGTTTISSNANLQWDDTNSFFGVGGTPTKPIHLQVAAGTLDEALKVQSLGASAISISVRNTTSLGRFFIAGTTNDWVPGTAGGDSGVRPGDTQKFFIGDSVLARAVFDSSGQLGLRTIPGFQLHGVAPDSSSFNCTFDTYGTGTVPNFRGRAARGTLASPTQLLVDDNILAISGLPYNSSPGFAGGARAQILFVAGENQTGTNQGTYIVIKTTPTGGSTTIAERFRVGPAGQWGIGGATFGSTGNVFLSGGASAAPTWGSHDSITGLTSGDGHTQYALLAGRSGGQTLKGGTAAGDGLTLTATSGVGAGSEFVKIMGGNNGATQIAKFTTSASDPAIRFDETAETWFVRDITNLNPGFVAGALRFRMTSSNGTVQTGFGAAFAFDLENASGSNVTNAAYLGPFWTTTTAGAESAAFGLFLMDGGTNRETLRVTGSTTGGAIAGGSGASDGLILRATAGNGVGSEFVKIQGGNNGAIGLAWFRQTSSIPLAGFGADFSSDELTDLAGANILQLKADAISAIRVFSFGTGNPAIINGIASRGTQASRSAIQSADVLGQYGFWGQYDTTAGHIYKSAQLVISATENYSSTAGGGRITLWTTPNTTHSITAAFMVPEDGGMAIVDGITAPATLSGWAKIYVDTADGDLKVKFGDGTVKTIVTDT